ncbi:uncharacterized protein LOC116417744 [Nasonia vitripennis]|uniref:Uncharacterized protein n=1 Tax=Nasonia vitripennis TaxID=7425 RepID=A0A7M7R120_NASVI|nr:uncharacterized protein LOC116417744 [Nasonia vitripennis]XP_032456578.1 uncharacterized protein LOC116417744 [Nasonia vitripennis]
MFLEKGTDVNINDADTAVYDTPLLVAAGSSRANKLLPLLMQCGADVFVENAAGENVLHRQSGGPVQHTNMARVFIEMRVSLDRRDRRGLRGSRRIGEVLVGPQRKREFTRRPISTAFGGHKFEVGSAENFGQTRRKHSS